MIDLKMWVLADTDGAVYRDWDGDAILFRTKKAAQESRENCLMGKEYERYTPKKVRVIDAK